MKELENNSLISSGLASLRAVDELPKSYYKGEDEYDNDIYVDTYTEVGVVLDFYHEDGGWKSEAHQRLAKDLAHEVYINTLYN